MIPTEPFQTSPPRAMPVADQGNPSSQVMDDAQLPATKPSLPMRIWLALPDWVFRFLGLSFFVWWLSLDVHTYQEWFTDYRRYQNPLLLLKLMRMILVHLTFLLVTLAFVFRHAPKKRASQAREIVLPIVGAFWPFLPFITQIMIDTFWPSKSAVYNNFLWDHGINWTTPLNFLLFVVGSGLIIIGNAIDVWGYSRLFRSISIVAEARELQTTGPYRLVRHPIYFGHIIAQAGLWLFLAHRHWALYLYYMVFVSIQLYRSRVEEDVLEKAFGERYREYKRKTFWFF